MRACSYPKSRSTFGENALGSDGSDHDIMVGIDADLGGDFERAAGDGFRIEIHRQKRTGRSQRVIAAGADPHDAAALSALRFEYVAGAGQDQADFLVGD